MKKVAILSLVLAAWLGPLAHAEEASLADKAGHGIQKGGAAAAHGIEKGAQATARGLEKGAEATGHGVEKAIDATGRFFKRAGAWVDGKLHGGKASSEN